MNVPQRFIAFDNGKLIPDHILENIIYAAIRGLMTPSGKKLLLYPDRRTGRKSETGLRHIERIRKSEGITLERLAREYRQSVGVTAIRDKRRSAPKENRWLRGEKPLDLSQPSSGIGPTCVSNICDKCPVCGRALVGKRKDAKFCGATCRQRHSRHYRHQHRIFSKSG